MQAAAALLLRACAGHSAVYGGYLHHYRLLVPLATLLTDGTVLDTRALLRSTAMGAFIDIR
jgi:hypothetical protein